MAHTTADIRQQIERERSDLAGNVAELTARAKAAVDWRERVRRHPVMTLGSTFGAALILACLPSRAQASSTRTLLTQPSQTNRGQMSPSHRERARPAQGDRRPSRGSGLLRPIAGAVIGTATNALLRALEDAALNFLAKRRARHERAT
jgi:hypothetical protein